MSIFLKNLTLLLAGLSQSGNNEHLTHTKKKKKKPLTGTQKTESFLSVTEIYDFYFLLFETRDLFNFGVGLK